jgi:serine/threonine protein kinase
MSKTPLLHINEGEDHVNIEEAQVPYVCKRDLGQGTSGWVEEVQDALTGGVYARKKMRVVKYKQKDRPNVFQNELSIIRGLKNHHHMIRVFATYITSRYFGLILEPVASDGDLQAYLSTYRELLDGHTEVRESLADLTSMQVVLKCAFGCLLAGLAFMHEKKVRHKDIKPGNILIHHGTVLYTDFGCSFDSSSFPRSTTEGVPSFLTKRYSSPELLMHEPRNSKSDVFSLGCVFIEILAALTRDAVLEDAFTNGFGAALLDDLHEQLSRVQDEICPVTVVNTVIRMTQRDASDRICSVHAARVLLQLPEYRCSQCANSPIETWEVLVEHDRCLS